MWRVLRDMDRFNGASADTDAFSERFRGIGGKRDGAAGIEGNDKDGRGKRSISKLPALQQRPDIGVNASKRMRDNKRGHAGERGRARSPARALTEKDEGDGFRDYQAHATRV